MTGTRTPRPGDPLTQLVVVCHANIARSPLAMVMLEDQVRRRLGPRADVWVRSAGVRALEGHPAAEGSRRQAAARGLDLEAHRSSLLTRDDVAEADLVLTMSERQRAHAVRLHPPAVHRTFPLPEFARHCRRIAAVDEELPARDRVHAVVGRAGQSRPVAGSPDRVDDVADPFGGPEQGYAEMAERLEHLVADVAQVLFGPAPASRAGP